MDPFASYLIRLVAMELGLIRVKTVIGLRSYVVESSIIMPLCLYILVIAFLLCSNGYAINIE